MKGLATDITTGLESLQSSHSPSVLTNFTTLYLSDPPQDEGKLSLPDYGDEFIVDRKDFKVCRANVSGG